MAAEFRDEDDWLAIAKLGLAAEIDRLPGDRHGINPAPASIHGQLAKSSTAGVKKLTKSARVSSDRPADQAMRLSRRPSEAPVRNS